MIEAHSYVCPRCGVDYMHVERLAFHDRFEPEECRVMREVQEYPDRWAPFDYEED